MIDIATLGETMACLASASIGPLRHASSLSVGIAGAESNVAIGAARLGAAVSWTGRVGDDEFGRLITATLRGEGVQVVAAVDPTAPTGLLVKERRTSSASRVVYYRAGNAGSRLRVDDLDESAIAGAGVLHLSGITPALGADARAAVYAAIEIARGAGSVVSFDLNHRSRLWDEADAAATLRDLTRRADLVLATAEEAALVLGDSSLSRQASGAELAARLGDLGPASVIVKHGARGADALIDGVSIPVPPVRVHAVDPVGAGDAFAAGYLAGLTAGESVEARLALAARAGAFAVTVHGDWEGAPSRGDLGILDLDEGDVLR